VRIVLEGEPWVIRNHPSVVHFVICLASFLEISDTCISSSIRGISVVIDYCFLSQIFRENLGTFVSIHARRILVKCSTRSVYHVGHDYFVQSWIGSFIRDFSAYGGGYFFNWLRRVTFLIQMSIWQCCNPRFWNSITCILAVAEKWLQSELPNNRLVNILAKQVVHLLFSVYTSSKVPKW
jgi:hypothetical protein